MEIAIIGGTGLLGRQVSEELRARGHEVRAVSRNAPKYRADLTTGTGLDEALAGCDAVVDASNNSSKSAAATLVEGTRRFAGSNPASATKARRAPGPNEWQSAASRSGVVQRQGR